MEFQIARAGNLAADELDTLARAHQSVMLESRIVAESLIWVTEGHYQSS